MSKKKEEMSMNDVVLTLKEAAAFLKISERSLGYLVKTNQIRYSRMGQRNVRFTKFGLLQWLNERENVQLRYKDAGR